MFEELIVILLKSGRDGVALALRNDIDRWVNGPGREPSLKELRDHLRQVDKI